MISGIILAVCTAYSRSRGTGSHYKFMFHIIPDETQKVNIILFPIENCNCGGSCEDLIKRSRVEHKLYAWFLLMMEALCLRIRSLSQNTDIQVTLPYRLNTPTCTVQIGYGFYHSVFLLMRVEPCQLISRRQCRFKIIL